MKVNILKLTGTELPDSLSSIDSPPRQLYWAGEGPNGIMPRSRVAIVGSRKATPYGRSVTYDLAARLARAGVVIVSGLAYGVDSFAHRAALEAGGTTVGVLPTPIDKIAPAGHYHLANQIINCGGSLVSEYRPGSDIHKINFIVRNRIVSALSDVLVITEATRNSGSLHTARFALEQGKTVMAVPGNINSRTSEGCNNLIKSGAMPVTSADDIFFALGIRPEKDTAKKLGRGTPEQIEIFELIAEGVVEQEELAAASRLSVSQISGALTDLELQGRIRPMGAGTWTIA